MTNDTTTALLNPEDNASYVSTEEKPPVYAFKSIRLMPGATKTNFVCCMLFSVIMVFSMAGAGNLQLLILLDKDYYNIPQDHMGTLNSLILVIQSVVKMATVVFYGYLADKLGRRTAIFLAAVSFLISCFLVPTQKTFFPGFTIPTVLAANAYAAYASVPLLADYVADESKGTASAIFAVVVCLSALLSNIFMKVLFYANVPLGMCYYIVGASVFFMLLLNNLGLQKGTFHLQFQKSVVGSATEPEKPFMEKMKEAIKIFRGNSWLKMSLTLQIFGSSDFAIFMSFISLYIKSLFSDDTPVVDQNTTVNNFQSMILLMMMASNGFCAYMIDKKNKIIQPCLLALGGGAASLVLLALSFKPTAVTLYVGSVLFGLTLPGLNTITTLLNLRNFPADKRGLMNGFCQLVSNTSYFIIAGGGGLLYDNWRRNGPFVICAGLLVLAAFIVLFIYSGIPKTVKKDSVTSDKEAQIVDESKTTETGREDTPCN